jgi:GT2 family glycosyltransferase
LARDTPENEGPQIASLKRRIGQLEVVNEKLTFVAISLKGRNQDLTIRAEHLASVIRGIESSQVWKLTRPFISLLKAAKRLGKKATNGSPVQQNEGLEAAVDARYQVLFEAIWPSQELLNEQRQCALWLATGPRFATLVLVDEDSSPFLGATLDSLQAQSNPSASISIVRTNGFTGEIESGQLQTNVKLLASETTLGEAIGGLSEEYAVVVKAGLTLWPNALYEVAISILKQPTATFLYGDEDAIYSDGQSHGSPRLRPTWSPAYLRSTNYIGDAGFYAVELLKEISGRTSFGQTAGVYDLHLAISRHLEDARPGSPYREAEKEIVHIPKVIATEMKRGNSSDKPALEFDLRARGVQGTMEEVLPGLFRTREAGVQTELVSIIIPTKDQLAFVRRCVDSILAKSTYSYFEIILIDTGSTEKGVFEYYQEVCQDPKIRLLTWTKQFNFSAVCNYGAAEAQGRFFLFLNNDTEVLAGDWIESMLQYGVRPEVGSVGAKLLYPDGTLQHVGVMPGILGVAGHYLCGLPDRPGMDFPTRYTKDAPREVSCCTAACLLVRKEVFEMSGGFDESYRITFNDVDFAMRLLYDHGLYNVYTPFAILTHHESVSLGPRGGSIRGPQEFQKECDRMIARWSAELTSDPFYHPLIDLGSNIPNIRL